MSEHFVTIYYMQLFFCYGPTGNWSNFFLDIQTEFGGTNPIGMDEYYADGTNLPDVSVSGSSFTSGINTYAVYIK